MDLASLTWNLARAGGIAAYVMLSASVLLGLALSAGWRSPDWPRFITKGVHQHVTLAALIFTCIHGLAVWLDPYLKAGLADVLVPMLIAYRPLWVALGIVAGYLALALWLSEQIRPLIGYRAWRALHFAAFGAYALATVHGLAAGTDTNAGWALAMYALSVSGVLVLLAGRLTVAPGPYPVRAAFGATAAALVVGGGTWALRGPLQPDWGLAAGSRASLTGAVSAASPAAAPAPAPSSLNFDSKFSGSEQLTGGTLAISGSPAGRPGGRLEVDLSGRLQQQGTFSVSGGRISYSEGGDTFAGDLTSIDGSGRIESTLADGSGRRLDLVFTIGDIAGSTVSGTLSVRPA